MRRRLTTPLSLITLLGSLLVWLVAVPAASAGDPCYHDYVLPSDTSASTTQVKLLPCAYSPTVTVVRVGATVTFANVTDFTHLVTGANQAWGSRDAEVAPGKTVSYTFDQAGTYPYACALHRGMSGTIIVGDATPAAAVARSDTAAGAATASAEIPAGSPDARLILVSVLAGALLGGIVAWFVSRRSPVRGTESAEDVSRGV